MKRTLAAAVFAVSFAAFPFGASGEDKVGDSEKPVASEADAKPQAADALWKQIEDMKDPPMDAGKQSDRQYMQQFFKDMQERAKERGALARQFIEKYPDHPKKADALFVRAESFLRTRDRSPEFVETVHAFVKAAPNDDRGAMLLYSVAGMERDDAERAKIMRRIVEDYPDSDAGKMAKGGLRQADGVGKPFELSFTDAISGKKVSMADLKGKVVVVDFWATWCGPCVAEIPEMKKLYAEYKDRGVEFIGVSLDAPESAGGLKKLKDFVAEKGITWPQYYQGNGWQSEFSRSWGITGIPTLFIIDADGNLHSTRARGQLDKLIPELLKKAGKRVS
jgi:thiol-disulfide isomerase/thioredoxin